MDKRNWTYKLTVLESHLDQSYDWAEEADRKYCTDFADTGIHSGFTCAQDPAGPNLKIQISGPGYAHDKVGRRLYESNTTVLVDCEYDEYGIATQVTPASGKTRWIAVFVRFKTQYADAIVDGNGVSVYSNEYEDAEFFVRQGTEAVGPSKVALQTEALLVCDIELTDGMTQILNANIDLDRREDWYRELAATLVNLGTQTFGTSQAAVDQIVQWIDTLQISTGIGFTGSATWHDTNTWAATTVNAALDEIINELAEDTTNPGSDKIGSDNYVAGATFSLTRGSVWDQLKECADALDVAAQTNADENVTGQWDFTDFITVDVTGVGAANATAITADSKGTGHGGVFTGGATGDGLRGIGGATSGAGVTGTASQNDNGIEGIGHGTGGGGHFTAGATGNGVEGVGGATSGPGGVFNATNNDDGVEGGGHGTGHGGVFSGGATGHGVTGTGGGTSGAGGVFTATLNDNGVEGTGHGTGTGGVFLGGTPGAVLTGGHGVNATGGDGYSTSTAGSGGVFAGGTGPANGNGGRGVFGDGGDAGVTDGEGGDGGYFQAGDSSGANNEGGMGVYGLGGDCDAGEYGGIGGKFQGGLERGAIHLVPTATPDGGQIGDLYSTTAGVLYICTTAGKTPGAGRVWTKVGSQ